MKIVKTASGKSKIKLSKREWQDMGRKAGWMKKAMRQMSEEDFDRFVLPEAELVSTRGNAKVYKTDQEIVYVRHSLDFNHKNDPRGGGYTFDCDEHGHILEDSLRPEGRANYNMVINNADYIKSIRKVIESERTCHCGSGEIPEDVYDARGIFLDKVCDKCKKETLSRYRNDVLTDPNYWTDEPIEETD